MFRLAQMEAAAYRRWRIGQITSITVLGLSLSLGMLTVCNGDRGTGGGAFVIGIVLAAVIAIGTFGILYPIRARSLAAAFTEIEDPRFVGTLLTLLDSRKNDTAVEKHVVLALKRMLPRLRADQGRLLNITQRQRLYAFLETHSREQELMLTILKALEQIGDQNAIPSVHNYASYLSARSRFAHYRRKEAAQRKAADECLLFLRQQKSQSQQAQTLLRPSDASVHAPETLLRPAAEGSTLPQELLRPQHTSEEKE